MFAPRLKLSQESGSECAGDPGAASARGPAHEVDPVSDSAGERPGGGRILFFWAVLLVVAALLVEVGFRAVAAWRVGPSTFFYGTPLHRNTAQERWEAQSVARHENAGEGYTKYFPHQSLRDLNPRAGGLFEVRTNARGFRGEDFDVAKPPGTVRIVALGGSSTFGYGNRDPQTYPAQLEALLEQRCPDERRIEVINLGIPHQSSAQILALFRAEGLPLEPDVVTFYEGANDTVEVPVVALRAGLKRFEPLRQGLRFLRSHLLTLVFVDSLIDTKSRTFTREQVEKNSAGKAERFVDNLEALRALCAQRGIELVVASQLLQSQTIPREEIRGISQAEEIARVQQRLDERGWVGATEQWLLIHDRLMQAQRAWARQHGVHYMDLIERLGGDRSVLLSWVHVDPEGNRRIAAELAEALAPRVCGAVSR